jgi:hypothetical protein
MAVARPPSFTAQQLHEMIASGNAGSLWAWVARSAGAVYLTRRYIVQPDLYPASAQDRAIAIPHADRVALEGSAGRHNGCTSRE